MHSLSHQTEELAKHFCLSCLSFRRTAEVRPLADPGAGHKPGAASSDQRHVLGSRRSLQEAFSSSRRVKVKFLVCCRMPAAACSQDNLHQPKTLGN